MGAVSYPFLHTMGSAKYYRVIHLLINACRIGQAVDHLKSNFSADESPIVTPHVGRLEDVEPLLESRVSA